MKYKILAFSFLILLGAFGISVNPARAQLDDPSGYSGQVVDGNLTYTPLEPLSSNPSQQAPRNFCELLNLLFKVLIYVGGMLAVLFLVIGGISYMVSEVVDKRTRARARIRSAIYGLLVLLCSWIILNSINPQLVQACNLLAPANAVGYLPQAPASNNSVTINNGTLVAPGGNGAITNNQFQGSAQNLEALKAAGASYQQLQAFCTNNLGGTLAPSGYAEGMVAGCAIDLQTHNYGNKIYRGCVNVPTPSGSQQPCFFAQQ